MPAVSWEKERKPAPGSYLETTGTPCPSLRVATRLHPYWGTFPNLRLPVWLVTQNFSGCPRYRLWSAFLEEKMFGAAGRGAPCAGATRRPVVYGVRTQATYCPLFPRLCLFKAPTAAGAGVVCARAHSPRTSGRRVGAQASHCLRDRRPHEHRPRGPGTRESGQDSGRHWERAVIVSLAIL